jgi:hypothetical protein
MAIIFRPLNTVHEIMNKIGFEPGYAYDDLVFSNDAIFIVQFGKTDKQMGLHINEDCDAPVAEGIKKGFISFAKAKGITVTYSGTFKLNQKEGSEQIDIEFNSELVP